MVNEPQADKKTSVDYLVQGLGILPQNLVSLVLGAAVRARLPRVVAKPLNKAFVRTFGINMAEAERPLCDYGTIEDVFTRKLQVGCRRIDSVFVSPSDGNIVRSEAAIAGRAIQAKGLDYSLASLVFGSESNTSHFSPAWFTTIYLAPHNYHRVHAPFSGLVTSLRYVPGRLWPVNSPAVRSVPGLFCKNERLIFDFALEGDAKAWVVMVGAMNVGRMTTPLKDDFVSNAFDRQLGATSSVEMPIGKSLQAGDEIGTLMLGSTVIVVLDEKAKSILKPISQDKSRPIKMGQTLI